MTLEEMFCKEFTKMLSVRKANSPVLDLHSLEVPEECNKGILKYNKVYIKGISEEYYSKLNNTEALIWSGGKLVRRKFDYKGEYIKDKDGKYKVEDVPVPHNAIAVISDVKIGVPNKFKSPENFAYVDMIQSKGNSSDKRYIYIVPREYCFKLNQTALVLSLTKLRTYYQGMSMAFTNGYTVFVYVVPYKPTANTAKPYRILTTKTSIDYSEELKAIQQLWMQRGYIFTPELCALEEGYKGRDNIAYEVMPVVLDEYIRYDEDKSMSKVDDDTLENLWEGAE